MRNKIELKNKRKRDKEFKKLFNSVLKKVRRIKTHRTLKRALVADIYLCENIDLIHYLSTETFKTFKEYNECINAWLDLETKAFEYPYKIVYKIGYMKNITEMIRLHHNAMELEKEVKGNTTIGL